LSETVVNVEVMLEGNATVVSQDNRIVSALNTKSMLQNCRSLLGESGEVRVSEQEMIRSRIF
jgi:hypothetical protein